MDAFFGMGVPTTTDDSGYWLRLPHLWSVFVIPIVCFYAFLTVWVVKKVQGALAGEPGSAETELPSSPPSSSSQSDSANGAVSGG